MLRAILQALAAHAGLAGNTGSYMRLPAGGSAEQAALHIWLHLMCVSLRCQHMSTESLLRHVQAPGMAPVQMLRAILAALAAPAGLAGNTGSYMRLPAGDSAGIAALPPAAARAAFREQYAAVLVDPSGQLNLAAAMSAHALQQVSTWHDIAHSRHPGKRLHCQHRHC